MDRALKEVENRRYEIITPSREAKSVWPLLIGGMITISAFLFGWGARSYSIPSTEIPLTPSVVASDEFIVGSPEFATETPVVPSTGTPLTGTPSTVTIGTGLVPNITPTATETPQFDFCYNVSAMTPCSPYITSTPTKTPTVTATPTPLGICKETDYSDKTYEMLPCLKEAPMETNPWKLERD
jgi:hypothetical protein